MKAATAVIYNLYKTFRISIHAAREGGDCGMGVCTLINRISIHAAREGGDTPKGVMATVKVYFNPRRP